MPEPAAACVTMCTSMSPDSRMTVAPMPGPVKRGGEAGTAADADDQLRGIRRPREVDERTRNVLADDLVEGAAELLDERALAVEGLGMAGPQPVGSRDVHGEELAARTAGGDARPATEERLALGAAGQRDDDPLAGLPLARDAVLGAVGLERLVDLVGEPQQRELAEGGEVAEPEVVRQRGVDALGRVDESAREAIAQRLRGEVDDLDLVGGAQHRVGDGLALRHPGDLQHHVAERLDVLGVHRRDHVDARGEQVLDILPALRMPRAGRIGVGELVDEGDLGLAGQHRVDVHLLEGHAAVRLGAARHDLEPADHRGRGRAAVRLDEGHDDVMAFVARGAGPPRAWCRSCRRRERRRGAPEAAPVSWPAPSPVVRGRDSTAARSRWVRPGTRGPVPES